MILDNNNFGPEAFNKLTSEYSSYPIFGSLMAMENYTSLNWALMGANSMAPSIFQLNSTMHNNVTLAGSLLNVVAQYAADTVLNRFLSNLPSGKKRVEFHFVNNLNLLSLDILNTSDHKFTNPLITVNVGRAKINSFSITSSASPGALIYKALINTSMGGNAAAAAAAGGKNAGAAAPAPKVNAAPAAPTLIAALNAAPKAASLAPAKVSSFSTGPDFNRMITNSLLDISHLDNQYVGLNSDYNPLLNSTSRIKTHKRSIRRPHSLLDKHHLNGSRLQNSRFFVSLSRPLLDAGKTGDGGAADGAPAPAAKDEKAPAPAADGAPAPAAKDEKAPAPAPAADGAPAPAKKDEKAPAAAPVAEPVAEPAKEVKPAAPAKEVKPGAPKAKPNLVPAAAPVAPVALGNAGAAPANGDNLISLSEQLTNVGLELNTTALDRFFNANTVFKFENSTGKYGQKAVLVDIGIYQNTIPYKWDIAIADLNANLNYSVGFKGSYDYVAASNNAFKTAFSWSDIQTYPVFLNANVGVTFGMSKCIFTPSVILKSILG